MKARLRLAGAWHLLELPPQAALEASSSKVVVSLDGHEREVDAVRVPGGVNLLLDGRVVEVLVTEEDRPKERSRSLTLSLAGAEAQAELQDGHAERISVQPVRLDTSELRAPMPGRIVRVMKSVGERIEEGAPMVVMAAMKMENELRAPMTGRIAEVLVAENDSVERGALLVRLDTEEHVSQTD